jgi:hypothetical protein
MFSAQTKQNDPNETVVPSVDWFELKGHFSNVCPSGLRVTKSVCHLEKIYR